MAERSLLDFAERAEPGPGDRARASRPRRRRLLLLAGLVLVLLSLASAVLAAVELKQAETSLRRAGQLALAGKVTEARAPLAAASRHGRIAGLVVDSPPARLVGAIPLLGTSVADARHLTHALRDLVGVADETVAAYARLTPESPRPLFSNGQVDLARVPQLTERAVAVQQHLTEARAELVQVKGGVTSPLAAGFRDDALAKVDQGLEGATVAQQALAQLPALLGAERPQRYLVLVLNPAELRTSGGAPLSLVTVLADQGRIAVEEEGATQRLTDNHTRIKYPVVAGNEYWHKPGEGTILVNANFSPDWPTSGEELARAYEAEFGDAIDGVVTLDPTVLADILRRTGAVSSPLYGRVTGVNLVQKVLVEAYDKLSLDDRRDANSQLTDVIIGRALGGKGLVPVLRSFGDGMPGRHVHAYFRDPAAQALVADHTVGGLFLGTAEPAADLLGVFTMNTNASKVDVFQERTVDQTVTLLPDGSARVERVVTVTNTGPPFAPPTFGGGPTKDPKEGYYTAISGVSAFLYLPADARDATVTTSLPAYVPASGVDRGVPVYRVSTRLPPEESFTVTARYVLPRSADGGYHVVMQTQPTLIPQRLTLTVKAPGRSVSVADPQGLRRDGTGQAVRLTGPVVTDLDLRFTVGG